MKKKILTIGLLASSLALTACSTKDPISENEAMKIALKDAGVKQSDATFTEQKYDKEDFEYSFTFHTTDTKYEYDIDGSGDVVSHEKEIIKNNNTTTPNVTTTDVNGVTLSDEQKAFLDIALTNHQLLAEEVSKIEVKQDSENGVPVYDVTFHKDNKEYNCEIQIDNKQILSSDVDQD